MVAISLMIEGQMGLTWPRWKRLVEAADNWGFAGLFRSDHFTDAEPPDQDSLEMLVSLAYAADHTSKIHFGPLVAPLSFRHPTLLARQAAALDDLSEGRMILGLGAGWQEREHHLFGHALGDIPTRMARFEEGLEVVTRLLKSAEPVTFEGRFFQLHGATLLPRPQQSGGPRILIGGNGPQRTLPLTARYADIWNAVFVTPTDFRKRNAILDGLLEKAGRELTSVRRTAMTRLVYGHDEAALRRNLGDPDYATMASADMLKQLGGQEHIVAGSTELVIEQIKRFGEAGVEELMLQWINVDDLESLRAFTENVLPHV